MKSRESRELLVALLFFIFIFNLIDAYTTVIGHIFGFTELNPFGLALLLTFKPWEFILIKALLGLLPILLIWVLWKISFLLKDEESEKVIRKTAYFCALAILIGQIICVFINLTILFMYAHLFA